LRIGTDSNSAWRQTDDLFTHGIRQMNFLRTGCHCLSLLTRAVRRQIRKNEKMKCYYCGKEDNELRPYGPKGSMVCFECAMATPEREKETERNFVAQLEAAGPIAVVGTEVGPFPIEHLSSDTEGEAHAMTKPK